MRALLARVVRWVVVLAAVVAVELVAIPAHVVAPLRRRDPVTGLRRRARSTWRVPSPSVRPDAGWAPTPWWRPPRRTVTFGRVVAGLALLVVLDLVAGSVVGLVVHPDPSAAADWRFPLSPATPPAPGKIEPLAPDAPAASSPALRGAPWAHDYYRELHSIDYDEQPYTLVRPLDRTGRYVTIRDNARVSYEPAARHVPTVWIFGGSTVFGEGQRDGHTIASELARVAEADGHPIHIVNLGIEGVVREQEALWFEQRLAARPHPDLAVFYDGANDAFVHDAQDPTDQPSVLDGSWLPQGALPVDGSALAAWGRASFWWTRQHDSYYWPKGIRQRAEQMLSVYGRGIALTRQIAAHAGVPVVNVFQPAQALEHRTLTGPYIRAHLPPGIVDLSHALDGPRGQATYIDSVHTNELGARLVAEALYRQLRPAIVRLGAHR